MRARRQQLTSVSGNESLGVSRRSFLAGLAALPFAAGRPWGAFITLAAQEPPTFLPTAPYSRAFNFSSLKQWITPNEEFFVRSHFGVPKIDVLPRSVTVSGAVDLPQTFRLDEVMKLPSQEEVVTLECAGNLVGWGGVSNARWTGIRLAALLESAGVRTGAIEVVLVGADGGAEKEAPGVQIDAYARSIPLAKALDRHTLVVFKMNGEKLSPEHGGPMRAIVPGWYGMDSVKWLKQVVVSSSEFKGFYQTERYYEARSLGGRIQRRALEAMRVKSQIARPLRGQIFSLGPVTIAGAAWSGEAEIARVDLSFDGGRAWNEARLGAERAPFAWRLWYYEWRPSAPGRYEIIARARDTGGREQPLERDPLVVTPYGNNWADRRTVEVI